MSPALCRLCVVKIEPNSVNNAATINNEIYTKIQMHLNLDIKINDIHSLSICTSCVEKINQFHEYYQRVHENQEKYNQLLNVFKESIQNDNSTVFEAVTLDVTKSEECHLEDDASNKNTSKCKRLRKSNRNSNSITNSKIDAIIKNDLDECTTNDPLHSEKNKKRIRTKKRIKTEKESNNCLEKELKSVSQKKSKKKECLSASAIPVVTPSVPPPMLIMVNPMLEISNKGNEDIKTDNIIKQHDNSIKDDNGDDDDDVVDDDFEFEDTADNKCEELDEFENKDFPKVVVKDGKFIIQGHELTRHMQKFFLLTCDLCPLQFSNFPSLKSLFAHYKDVHGIKGYVSCCGKKLSRRAMTHHFASHINPEEYTCKECGLTVTEPHSLKGHMERKHGSDANRQKFPCLICQRVYKNPKSLKHHQMEKHPSEEQQSMKFQCKECEKSFNSEFRLQEHLKNVHVEKIHVCHVCGKGFRLKGNLKYHQATHEEHSNVVQCEVCGKWLKSELVARKHYNRQHTSTVVHKCDLCEYTSLIKRNLTMHMRIRHSNKKPHACPYCDHKFKSRTNLNDHITQHTGIKTQCEFCSKEFITKSNYYAHRKKTHFEELEKLNRQRELELITKSSSF